MHFHLSRFALGSVPWGWEYLSSSQADWLGKSLALASPKCVSIARSAGCESASASRRLGNATSRVEHLRVEVTAAVARLQKVCSRLLGRGESI